MKVLLATTDFSDAAFNAASYAAAMARTIGAKLLLVHIYQADDARFVPGETNDEANTKTCAEKKLQEIRQELVARTAGELTIEIILSEGTFFDELKAVCQKINPYLLVMGNQGHNAAEHVLFGRHTLAVVQKMRYPLILVPANAKFTQLKRIGLACDFEKTVDTTPVDDITTLVCEMGAELHVFNTGKLKVYNPSIILESQKLQRLLTALKPFYHYTTNPDIDEGILDFAERTQLELLLLLPGRSHFIERLLQRNHTQQMILRSLVPVIILYQR
jgi:nucleotide-binding universal stress UspA family protein